MKYILALMLAVIAAGDDRTNINNISLTSAPTGWISDTNFGPAWGGRDLVHGFYRNEVIIDLSNTRLELTISTNATTNWTTVSRTSPVIPEGEITYAVHRATMLNQVGAITTNRVLTVVHGGKTNSIPIAQIGQAPSIERSIAETPGEQYMNLLGN